MKENRIIVLLILVAAFAKQQAYGQETRWSALPNHAAGHFDVEAVQLDDQRRAEAGELELYARRLPLQASSWNDGVWEVGSADRVCRIKVASRGAMGMELLLEEIKVPSGAVIRMLAEDGRELSASVPLDLPDGVMEFTTPMVSADVAVLEYRQPADAPFEGRFKVNGLAHAYRYVSDVLREGPCHVNVACTPESNGWDGPIRATVRISVVTPQGSGWCSGTLVNNVRQDCEPYILTAWHCGKASSTAHFNQYQFYFNFQYATCAGGAYSTAQVLTGAQLKAYSDDHDSPFQNLGGSDFMLVRLNRPIPSSFEPYWAGWDARSISAVAEDGVCVHHPTGAPKRISTYTQTATTGHPMASSGLMTHYKLKWAQTQNGFGVTEYGSSGSGLFKPHATAGPVLIGTLTGSSSGTSCVSNQGTIYFGKMSYHWTNNPNAPAVKLKPWLDPDGTGTLVLEGGPAPCSAPTTVEESSGTGKVLLFPNPATDRLHVHGQGLGTLDWIMTDASGRAVSRGRLAGTMDTIDLGGTSPGIYFLQMRLPDDELIRMPFVVAR